MTHYTAYKVGIRVKDARPSLATVYCLDCVALRPDIIDFRFRFSAESPALLSVAHTVSAECVTSLSAYFQ